MMKKVLLFAFVVLTVLFIGTEFSYSIQQGRIYGRVYVRNGEVFEGRIKWGDHETIWDDMFDGETEFYSRYKYYKDNYPERKWRIRRGGYVTVQTSFKFGRIMWIKRKYKDLALVKLKDGREIEVKGGDAEDEDVTVNDIDFGDVVVKWRRIEKVEFMDEPESYSKLNPERNHPLYGTVETEEGDKFRGYIMWDNDESLSDDILDGEDDDGFKRKIRFEKISEIEKISRNEVRVTLKSGRKIYLTGSNDVNSDNRGILIKDPDYGNVKLRWREFYRVTFEDSIKVKRYSDFEKGYPLYGTVFTIDGDSIEGYIRWDDDESYSCDILNGEYDRYIMEIEFGKIKEIRRRSRRACIVVLKNGIELELRGSNDVNNENKGIIVFEKPDSKEGEYIDWRDFSRVVFR
ncbi:hypothetical protein DRQ09_09690 [candidate division KSB1 bacterium]|nr:MAG: hypothetical protein DRQ09_09690 [candidate division KSB1 bacterium]